MFECFPGFKRTYTLQECMFVYVLGKMSKNENQDKNMLPTAGRATFSEPPKTKDPKTMESQRRKTKSFSFMKIKSMIFFALVWRFFASRDFGKCFGEMFSTFLVNRQQKRSHTNQAPTVVGACFHETPVPRHISHESNPA